MSLAMILHCISVYFVRPLDVCQWVSANMTHNMWYLAAFSEGFGSINEL